MTARYGTTRWALLLAFAGYLGALVVNRSLVEVQGTSMEPALWPGDRLMTVPAIPWLLRPGLVVVVADPRDPDHRVVKRVLEVDADTVDVRGDAPDRSTDGRHWGRLPRVAIRRIVVARWPDVRSRLHRLPDATDQPGLRATTSSSGSSSATSPSARRP